MENAQPSKSNLDKPFSLLIWANVPGLICLNKTESTGLIIHNT